MLLVALDHLLQLLLNLLSVETVAVLQLLLNLQLNEHVLLLLVVQWLLIPSALQNWGQVMGEFLL